MTVDTTVLRRTADVLDDLVAMAADDRARAGMEFGWPHHADRVRAVLSAGQADPRAALLADSAIATFAQDVAHERCCAETAEVGDDLYYDLANRLVDAIRDPADAAGPPAWVTPAAWQQAVAGLHGVDDTALVRHAEQAVDDGPLSSDIEDEATRRHVDTCARGSIGGGFHSM